MPNMTRQEYIKFQNETIAKSRLIYQKALEYCPKLLKEETYMSFLSFLAKWNHFSAVNIVLLYMQYPEASYLSGFSRWQDLALEQGYDNNHTIIKPEQRKKGITLLIPFSFSNVQMSSGQPIEQRYLTYKSVVVFDVSQVNNISAPPFFSPYVPIYKLDFDVLILLCRNQFQKDLAIAPGSANDPNFQYCNAYLKGNFIYYQDAAPNQEKIIGILSEIIRFYTYRIYKDEEERDLLYLSTVYTILYYFKYPTNKIKFPSVSYYGNLPSEKIFRIIHYICTLTQQFIYELYKAYQYFLVRYSDKDSNKILKQYEDL